jgi:glutamyl-tRNA synthetase
MEQDAVNKNVLKHEGLRKWFQILADRFESLAEFENAQIESMIRDMAEKENVKAGILINGIRTAVTGQAVGPGIFELLNALGRERVVRRLRKAVGLFG